MTSASSCRPSSSAMPARSCGSPIRRGQSIRPPACEKKMDVHDAADVADLLRVGPCWLPDCSRSVACQRAAGVVGLVILVPAFGWVTVWRRRGRPGPAGFVAGRKGAGRAERGSRRRRKLGSARGGGFGRRPGLVGPGVPLAIRAMASRTAKMAVVPTVLSGSRSRMLRSWLHSRGPCGGSRVSRNPSSATCHSSRWWSARARHVAHRSWMSVRTGQAHSPMPG